MPVLEGSLKHLLYMIMCGDGCEADIGHLDCMQPHKAKANKAIVLEAFDTLFNKRNYAAAELFWSPDYIQHSAHIGAGRDGLFSLTQTLPLTLRYENALAVAEGDYVILHGRFSDQGQPRSWIVVDIVLLRDGVLIEHWDVIQDEATKVESKSGRPMFGATFAG